MKDWFEAVYATVRYYVDPRFRKQVKQYRVWIEAQMVWPVEEEDDRW